ncbi:hypothetical protein AcW1_001936 [Taiwanofungus camphoratus]|nr:hypothetical protein AcW1_001936 [Antrodia cinnamomea]
MPLRTRDARDFEDHRWSDVIPPHNALTFAAVWDPVEGMITFSGAHLLDSECADRATTNPCAGDSPRDVADGQSQVLTIDRFALALASTAPSTAFGMGSEATRPYSSACEAQTDSDTVMDPHLLPAWITIPPGMRTTPQSPAFASSVALANLVHESDFPTLLKSSPDLSHLTNVGRQLRSIAPFKRLPIYVESPSTSSSSEPSVMQESVTDEGFFEGRQLPTGSYGSLPVFVNLNLVSYSTLSPYPLTPTGSQSSAFSVTTTSTNNYVEVDFPSDESWAKQPSDDSSSWETLHGIDRAFCFNIPPPERRRRLKKWRSEGSSPTTPASPAEVLARQHYNHVQPLGPTSRCAISRKKSIARAKALLDRLGKCVKNEEDGWVCVEVTHKVTHKVARHVV